MPTVSIGPDTFSIVNVPSVAMMGTTPTVFGYGYGTTPGQIGISFAPSAAQGVTLAYGVAQTVTLGTVTQNEGPNSGKTSPTHAPQLYPANGASPAVSDESGSTTYYAGTSVLINSGAPNSGTTILGGFYSPAEGTGGSGVPQPNNTILANNGDLDVGLGFTVTDGTATATLNYLAALGRTAGAAPSNATGLVTLYHGYVADPDLDYRLDLGTQIASFANGDVLKVAFNSLALANNPDTASLTATLTLTSAYAITAAGADKPDGARGVTPYTFTATRAGDTSQAVALSYAVGGTGSNPAPGYMFANPAGAVAFAAGAAAATVTINVNAAAVRAAETFAVTLAGSAGATPTIASATGVIRPNNTAVAGAHDLLLTGAHDQYVIASTSDGRAYIQDTVAWRDGTQAVAGLQHVNFADGNGEFDPSGTLENITRLYQAAFNRTPDLAGLDGNAGLLQGGTVPLSALAQSFTRSPEFLSLYGAPDNAGFVQQMYQNVLHRAPDAAGQQAWLDALGSGATRGQVLAGFADSSENRRQVLPIAGDRNDAEAARMYQAAFNRVPDAKGLAFWSGKLQAGANPEDVVQGFTASDEFKQLYGTLNTVGFVTQLYANVLNRAPDAAGEKHWVDLLNGGATPQHVLIGFSDSTENRIKTAGTTHDAWVFLG